MLPRLSLLDFFWVAPLVFVDVETFDLFSLLSDVCVLSNKTVQPDRRMVELANMLRSVVIFMMFLCLDSAVQIYTLFVCNPNGLAFWKLPMLCTCSCGNGIQKRNEGHLLPNS